MAYPMEGIVGQIRFQCDTSGIDQAQASLQGLQQQGTSVNASCEQTSNSMEGLGEAFTKIAHLGTAVQTALLRVDNSQNRVENATDRARLAQERYSEAVANFGPESEQAVKAHQQLEISTRNLEISQNRLSLTYITASSAVIPAVISTVQTLVSSLGPLGIAIAAIIAVITVLYLAWQNNWGGMRDTLNKISDDIKKIFEPLKEDFKKIGIDLDNLRGIWDKAWKLISGALEAFWNNIGKPIFEFLVGMIKTFVIPVIQKLQEAWEKLKPAVEKVWEAFGKLIDKLLGTSGETDKARSAGEKFGDILAKIVIPFIEKYIDVVIKVADWLIKLIDVISDTIDKIRSFVDWVRKGWEEIEKWIGWIQKAIDWLTGHSLKSSLEFCIGSLGDLADKFKAMKKPIDDFIAWLASIPTSIVVTIWTWYKKKGDGDGNDNNDGGTPPTTVQQQTAQVAAATQAISISAKRGQFGLDEIVRRPTLFMAGEAGPEHVSITPGGRRQGGDMYFHIEHVHLGRKATKADAEEFFDLIEAVGRNRNLRFGIRGEHF